MKEISTILNESKKRIRSAYWVLRNAFFGCREIIFDTEIRGDKRFCDAVKNALLLVKEKDAMSFDLINKNLKLVLQSTETLLDIHRDGVTLSLDDKEVKSSSTPWLVGLLMKHIPLNTKNLTKLGWKMVIGILCINV